jgi:NADH pyrophosphatase NudC (nudix superfamily)
MVDAGEDLSSAVEREVLEETGIQSQFVSILGFRHGHGFSHGRSDLYFVCRLTAKSYEIKKQDEEIAECKWVKVKSLL